MIDGVVLLTWRGWCMSVAIIADPEPLQAYTNFPYKTDPMPLNDLVTQGLITVPKPSDQSANPLRYEP